MPKSGEARATDNAQRTTHNEEAGDQGHRFDPKNFDLQPGEMTKDMVAKHSGNSLRAVELWKAAGKLPAEKKRRRVTDKNGNQVVKEVLIFMRNDVDALLNADKKIPVVDRATPEMAMTVTEKMAESNMQAIAVLGHALGLGQKRDPFITVKEAATEYHLSALGIHKMILDGTLKRFPGPNGLTMVSRRQIESL